MLGQLDQRFPRKFEYREKSHDQLGHALAGTEQLREFNQFHFLQPAQNRAHMLAHRQLVPRDAVMLVDIRPLQQPQPRLAQILGVDPRQCLGNFLVYPYLHQLEVAPRLRQLIELMRSALHLFVSE